MKRSSFVRLATIFLAVVAACAIVSGGSVHALTQDENATPIGLNQSDHSTYLGLFARSALTSYGVQPLGNEVPFSPLPQQIPELRICVPAREKSGTLHFRW